MPLLITGGAGFIGSQLLRHIVTSYPRYFIVCADSLTYAADYSFIADLEGYPNYTFVKLDITDKVSVDELFQKYGFTHVIHLEAESHVDNSIKDPLSFAHGYATLTDSATVLYKVDQYYNKNYDTGIHPLSSGLSIDWGVKPILSEKDQNLSEYSNFKSPF